MATAAGPRSVYASLDGLRLHYLEWGAPDAPPLVLLHALGALVTAHDWQGFAAEMQGTHRVIAPDQRGFGLSDRMPAYSFQLMAQDLAQLVECLSLSSFSLIGHSMGATVASLYAESGPARLRRLVLEDTAPPREGRRNQRPDDVQWEFADLDELLAVARQRGIQGSDDELRARVAPAVRQLDGGRIAFRINVPTLVVRGADSPVLDAQLANQVATAIPDCQVVEVGHAGHSVHADNPVGFLGAVRDFVD